MKLFKNFSFIFEILDAIIIPVAKGAKYKIYGVQENLDTVHKIAGWQFIYYKDPCIMPLMRFSYIKPYKLFKWSLCLYISIGFRLEPSYQEIKKPKIIGFSLSINPIKKYG